MDDQQKIQLAVNSLTSAVRAEFAAAYGQTSNSKRSRIYDEFGYPSELRFDDFYRAYDRNALAGAAVDRVCDDSWQDFPEVFEGTREEDAEGMTTWDDAANKLLARCWPQIVEADRRNLVGRYMLYHGIIGAVTIEQRGEPREAVYSHAF